MNNVAKLIERFGGLTAMSRALGHRYPTTVQGWQQRNQIPLKQIPRVIEAATTHGIDVNITELISFDQAA